MLEEDKLIGLAEAVRILKDPEITVTGLRDAIKDGRLTATEDPKRPGFLLVTLGAIRAMKAGKAQPEPETPAEPQVVAPDVPLTETRSSKRKKKYRFSKG